MRRLIVAALAATALVFGMSGAAEAIRDPFPTCIRECFPVPLPDPNDIPRPGPCNGVGFC